MKNMIDLGISLEVNNKRKIGIYQTKHDGEISVIKYSDDCDDTEKYSISNGDFVTILNWYKYQKSIGNDRLMF